MKSVDSEINSQIIQLLNKADLNVEKLSISPFNLGGNNQTFRIETSSGLFVAKKYFSHRHDKRDRLQSEFSFLSFAYSLAKGIVPKAIAKLKPFNIALYEFIEGSSFKTGEIGQEEVSAAVDFFCKINQPEYRQLAKDLPEASEACFSIEDHILLIQNRINQIYETSAETIEAKQAKDCAKRLNKHLEQLKPFTLKSKLAPEQRCISPSDFGFHNALKKPDNTICFIDFEYAGLDDPAKMVGDFFSQLSVPVPAHYFETFTQKTMSCFPNGEELIKRALFLRPIYQIKWCCIALNIFLPYHLERRKFANQDLNLAKLQRNQLAKAIKILELLENEYAKC